MSKPRSAAAIIAVVLLLLPMLYVGSFYLLAEPYERPDGHRVYLYTVPRHEDESAYSAYRRFYTIYWPLEKMDRAMRPDSWWPKYSAD